MSKGWKDRDSQAALEATRYENPIPSRLFIMETLEQNGAPMSHRALCRVLGVKTEEQQEALMFRLKAMIRDGQLLQNRKRRNLCQPDIFSVDYVQGFRLAVIIVLVVTIIAIVITPTTATV